jgi:hypothetical protein
MLHFSCDSCGKALSADAGGRYVVKVESFAAHDPDALTDADLAEDQLAEMSSFLEDLESLELGENVTAPTTTALRFDLCPECHRKFLRDPLNRETAPKFDFSKN